MSQEDRSEALIDVLEDLEATDLRFVLVGGYAISQYETRFSTDLDIVVTPEEYDEVVAFLGEHDFERQDHLEVPPDETIYDREIELFERRAGLVHPVGVDVLINGLGCRQTEAEWSFQYLHDHSSERPITGGSQSTSARTVDGEVLVAAKLHSARPTDLADVLAAVPDIDFDAVTRHLERGDDAKLEAQLTEALHFIDDGGLDHRFKSQFGTASASDEDLDRLVSYLNQQLS
jgi:hypothetical protein